MGTILVFSFILFGAMCFLLFHKIPQLETEGNIREAHAIKCERLRLLLLHAMAEAREVKIQWHDKALSGYVKEFRISDGGIMWLEFKDSNSPHSLADAAEIHIKDKGFVTLDKACDFEKYFVPNLEHLYPYEESRIGGFPGHPIRATQIGWTTVNYGKLAQQK